MRYEREEKYLVLKERERVARERMAGREIEEHVGEAGQKGRRCDADATHGTIEGHGVEGLLVYRVAWEVGCRPLGGGEGRMGMVRTVVPHGV